MHNSNLKDALVRWYQQIPNVEEGRTLMYFPKYKLENNALELTLITNQEANGTIGVLVQWAEHTEELQKAGLQPAYKYWQPQNARKKEVLTHPYDHVTKDEDDIYNSDEFNPEVTLFCVPCKVLGFDQLSDGTYMAFVHSPETQCQTNTLISRKWLLRHQLQSITVVKVRSIITNVLVVEEEPGFQFRLFQSKTP